MGALKRAGWDKRDAKKLCCDLAWDAKDIVKQGSTGSMTTGSMFVAAMMSLVVAMLV